MEEDEKWLSKSRLAQRGTCKTNIFETDLKVTNWSLFFFGWIQTHRIGYFGGNLGLFFVILTQLVERDPKFGSFGGWVGQMSIDRTPIKLNLI